jgi:hypothetical protein
MESDPLSSFADQEGPDLLQLLASAGQRGQESRQFFAQEIVTFGATHQPALHAASPDGALPAEAARPSPRKAAVAGHIAGAQPGLAGILAGQALERRPIVDLGSLVAQTSGAIQPARSHQLSHKPLFFEVSGCFFVAIS